MRDLAYCGSTPKPRHGYSLPVQRCHIMSTPCHKPKLPVQPPLLCRTRLSHRPGVHQHPVLQPLSRRRERRLVARPRAKAPRERHGPPRPPSRQQPRTLPPLLPAPPPLLHDETLEAAGAALGDGVEGREGRGAIRRDYGGREVGGAAEGGGYRGYQGGIGDSGAVAEAAVDGAGKLPCSAGPVWM